MRTARAVFAHSEWRSAGCQSSWALGCHSLPVKSLCSYLAPMVSHNRSASRVHSSWRKPLYRWSVPFGSRAWNISWSNSPCTVR